MVLGVSPAVAEGTPGVNGGYAVQAALALLDRTAAAAEGPSALWAKTGGRGKAQNSQMDVVLALWGENRLCTR